MASTTPENNVLKTKTLKENPEYFGAYLNMARHNVFLISNHLVEKLKLKDLHNIIDDDAKIRTNYLTNKLKSSENLIFTQITRFMPITKVFDTDLLPKDEKVKVSIPKIDFESMAKSLGCYFKYLCDFRDDYSHFYHKERGIDRLTHINEELTELLNQNFERARLYTQKRFEGVFEDGDFKIVNTDISLVNKNDKIIINNKPHYRITKDGLVFFICLFLNREDAFQFFNRIRGFKNSTRSDYKATREVFSAFCLNLPHDKFISENQEQALVLDMLSELHKCPKDLFENLAHKEQKIFLPNVEHKIKQISENSIPDNLAFEEYDAYIQNITRKVRKTDRFTDFALNYLDQSEDFNIYFHINIGKVIVDSYKKEFLNKKEDREIETSLKVFDKLKKYQDEEFIRTFKGYGLINELQFEQYRPHFHIENNKLGISTEVIIEKVKNNKKEDRLRKIVPNPLPKAFLSVHELPKLIILEILQKGKAKELIKEFLKKNNELIFNRDFIETIKSKLGFNIPFPKDYQSRKEKSAYDESKLETLRERKTALNKVLIPYGLDEKQIPNRIVDYWLNIEEVLDTDEFANYIKAIKSDCVSRLKAKKKNKAPKIGEMASFLAKDIIDMVINERVKSKITSFYYNKIQECIALFVDPEKREIFIDMCGKELNLFDRKIGHPFLLDIQLHQISGTVEFYEKYLIKKGNDFINDKNVSWLYKSFYKTIKNQDNGTPETIIEMPRNTAFVPLTIVNKNKEKSSFDNWIQNVSKGLKDERHEVKAKPVDLPTNLFDETIETLLKQELTRQGIHYEEKDKFSKLVQRWTNNDAQPMYAGSRNYKIYDTEIQFNPNDDIALKEHYLDKLEKIRTQLNGLKQKANPNIDKKELYTIEQLKTTFRKMILENEKVIRHHLTKDRITLLMVHKMLGASINDLNMKLAEMYPGSEKNVLEVEEEISEKIYRKLSFTADGNPINNEIDKNEIIEKTIIGKRKRKDYSVFKHLIHDRRLPELCQYFDDESIAYETLKEELRVYQGCREKTFDMIFKLEKQIVNYKNAKEEIIDMINKDDTFKNTPHIQFKPYLKWLKDNNYINSEEYLFMNLVRNTFSHNQFPPRHIMEKSITFTTEETFSQQIFKAYETKTECILNELKKNDPNFEF